MRLGEAEWGHNQGVRGGARVADNVLRVVRSGAYQPTWHDPDPGVLTAALATLTAGQRFVAS